MILQIDDTRVGHYVYVEFPYRDVLVLVLVLTRVLFSVLSCTLYLAKFMSTCTHYLLKYCYKKPCTHEYITSLTEYFFKFQSERKKVNCFSGPPSSVSNAPHLSFFRLEKKWPHKYKYKKMPVPSFFHKSGLRTLVYFLSNMLIFRKKCILHVKLF